MSDKPRQLTSEERERVYAAKEYGALCAVCGRGLSAGETVYMERFWVSMRLFGDPEKPGSRVFAEAPVGVECVSPGFRTETEDMELERCDTCGRGVYYQLRRPHRRRARCSTRCRRRATTATTGVAG